MSMIKQSLHNGTMNRLEMLTAREQLMEDIDSIIESYQSDENFDINDCDDRDDLIRILCDAVCSNFPAQ